jgi:hypothetical protein
MKGKRMAKLSGKGGPAGGYGSKVVKEVGTRAGQVAKMKNPAAVSQIGSAVGNHLSDGPRSATNYKGDKMVLGDLVRPGQPRMGNEVAFNTQAGPGGSRDVSKTGSQGMHGQPTGTPWSPGRGFDERGTVKKV